MTSPFAAARWEREADARTLGGMLTDVFPPEASLSENDWCRLARRAIDERLGPLLFWKLRDDPRVPPGCLERLRGELYRAEAFSLTLYRQLARLLEAGASRCLTPPVVLKGGALAATLYPEIGLRPMSDLDMLVPRHELDAWLQVARDAGLHRLCPEMALGLTERIHYQIALAGGTHPQAMIEIHFGLVAGSRDWRSPEAAWFLERCEPFEPPPESSCPPARQLLPGPHLLYLSAHAMLQHGRAQARLVWFHDMHLLISRRGPDIDWESLVAKARALRWEIALREALIRARELFGTPIPEAAMKALEAASDSTAAACVRRLADSSTSRAELVWSELGSVPSGDRVRWALAIMFPRPEYMKWRYPLAEAVWPLVYPYRWARILWEGCRALGRTARGLRNGRMPSC